MDYSLMFWIDFFRNCRRHLVLYAKMWSTNLLWWKSFEKYAKPMQLLRRNKRFMTGLSSWEWLIMKEESLNNNFLKEKNVNSFIWLHNTIGNLISHVWGIRKKFTARSALPSSFAIYQHNHKIKCKQRQNSISNRRIFWVFLILIFLPAEQAFWDSLQCNGLNLD